MTDFVSTLNEVVNLILAGHWTRYGARDGSLYYIIGNEDALWRDLTEGWAPGSGREPRSQAPTWKCPDIGVERYARALTGSEQPNYEERALEQLRESGIDVELVVGAVRKLLSSDPDWTAGLDREQIYALARYLEAVAADLTPIPDGLTELEAGQVSFALQQVYLCETVNRYTELCRRIGRLAPLPFPDRQLEEATQCWLHGFHRATIVLAAAALEHLLKTVTDTHFSASFPVLVDKAKEQGKVFEPNGEYAREVYHTRNAVVHKGWDPTAEDAEEMLIKVRGIMSSVLSPA